MPVETDCDSDYQRCKSKCFDALVDALAQIEGDDPQKIAAARQRYQNCLKLCKAAKAICDAETA